MRRERKRYGRIWALSDNEFIDVIKGAKSHADVVKFFGLTDAGWTRQSIMVRCKKLGLDFTYNKAIWNKASGTVPLEEMLICDSPYRAGVVKARLLRDGLLENKCQICRMEPFWNGQPLVLRLDHINGNRDDHRLENLRLVCPNCDSQLPTFTGRNKKRVVRPNCIDCGKEITMGGQRCGTCHRKNIFVTGERTHIEWPEIEEFNSLLEKLGYQGLADHLGISISSVNERIMRMRRYGVWKEGESHRKPKGKHKVKHAQPNVQTSSHP
jgi:transposase-like protein